MEAIVRQPYRREIIPAPRSSVGETVRFERFYEKDPAWFIGVDARGVRGYFPSAWFDVDDDVPEPPALREYDGHELSVDRGERVLELERYGGWRRVRIVGTNEVGWLPEEAFVEG